MTMCSLCHVCWVALSIQPIWRSITSAKVVVAAAGLPAMSCPRLKILTLCCCRCSPSPLPSLPLHLPPCSHVPRNTRHHSGIALTSPSLPLSSPPLTLTFPTPHSLPPSSPPSPLPHHAGGSHHLPVSRQWLAPADQPLAAHTRMRGALPHCNTPLPACRAPRK
jgi:hypothetical protein